MAGPAAVEGTKSKRGNFFAIDRRCWARVCMLGLNEAVAYLVLACGTGADQRTTFWSCKAVATHTGLHWRRAHAAIAALISSRSSSLKR